MLQTDINSHSRSYTFFLICSEKNENEDVGKSKCIFLSADNWKHTVVSHFAKKTTGRWNQIDRPPHQTPVCMLFLAPRTLIELFACLGETLLLSACFKDSLHPASRAGFNLGNDSRCQIETSCRCYTLQCNKAQRELLTSAANPSAWGHSVHYGKLISLCQV